MKRFLSLTFLASSVTLVGQATDRAGTEALASRAAERLRALHTPGSMPGSGSGLSAHRSFARPGFIFELRVDGQPVDPLQWLGKK